MPGGIKDKFIEAKPSKRGGHLSCALHQKERGEVGSLWVKAEAKEGSEASKYPERTLDPVLKFWAS